MKFLSTFCLVSLITVCFFSCDVLEPDADVLNPDVHITDEQVVVFYRNELAVNNRVSVFVQPFYKHVISSAEALREPFEVRWYHAGLTFEVVCRTK